MPQRKTSSRSLTHLDAVGRARMVDVSAKPVTARRAVATAEVSMKPATLRAIADARIPKGDVIAAARIAAIQAAKRTHELIPLCHGLPLESISVNFDTHPPGRLRITTAAHVRARTGVEM